MIEVETRVRELFDEYCRRHPNTRYQLRDDEDKRYFGIMRMWICNRMMMEHKCPTEPWGHRVPVVRAAIEKVVQEIVGGA